MFGLRVERFGQEISFRHDEHSIRLTRCPDLPLSVLVDRPLLNLLRRYPRAWKGRVVGEADLIDECRRQLDWLLRMQVPAGFPLAGMAFHRVHGTEWSPMPGWPHEDPTVRVLHRPSTAATLHLDAAAAQAPACFVTMTRRTRIGC